MPRRWGECNEIHMNGKTRVIYIMWNWQIWMMAQIFWSPHYKFSPSRGLLVQVFTFGSNDSKLTQVSIFTLHDKSNNQLLYICAHIGLVFYLDFESLICIVMVVLLIFWPNYILFELCDTCAGLKDHYWKHPLVGRSSKLGI